VPTERRNTIKVRSTTKPTVALSSGSHHPDCICNSKLALRKCARVTSRSATASHLQPRS